MLNYDMLASINYMRGVYDGKSNDTAAEIRDGSAYIQVTPWWSDLVLIRAEFVYQAIRGEEPQLDDYTVLWAV